MTPRLLLVEPFFGGSHKQLIDAVVSRLDPEDYLLITFPDKKWHWRARISALAISQQIPKDHAFATLFTSSVLSLAELVGLRPDLARLRKVVYFHESQLEYPVRKAQERDFQFGYNQITTCLAADIVLFNSSTLLQTFLSAIPKFLRQQPDCRPDCDSIQAGIESKSSVCYFPLLLPSARPHPPSPPLHIAWPHRWEHDKDPDTFFRVVFRLLEEGLDFRVSVIGQTYDVVPDIFAEAEQRLRDRLVVFGFKSDKAEYHRSLSACHVVVSTALHETYGVAMLEASALGCYPLVPNRLVYPELYPLECLYNTEQQLYKRLREMCKNPPLAADRPGIEFERFAGSAPLQQLLDSLGLD